MLLIVIRTDFFFLNYKCSSQQKTTLFAQAYILRTMKFKFIGEITHATGKYSQGLLGLAISEGSFKSTKTIVYYIILLAWPCNV